MTPLNGLHTQPNTNPRLGAILATIVLAAWSCQYVLHSALVPLLGNAPLTHLVSRVLYMSAALALLLALTRRTLRSAIPLAPCRLRTLLLSFLLGASASTVLLFIDAPTLLVAGPESLRLIDCVLLAPFLEELLFRGAVLRLLLATCRPLRACLVTAYLFSLFHWNLIHALFHRTFEQPTFADVAFLVFTTPLLGFAFGLLVLRTSSILSAALSHAGANAAVLYVAPCLVAHNVHTWLIATTSASVLLLVILCLWLDSVPSATRAATRFGRPDSHASRR